VAFVSRHRRRLGIDIWPGFVDALSQLLIVIIFVVMIFTAAQFYLSTALSGSERALQDLHRQIDELTSQLSLQRTENDQMRSDLQDVSAQLKASIEARDQLQVRLSELGAGADESLAKTKDELAEKDTALRTAQDQVALLNEQILALRDQLARLSAALDASEQKAKDQEVQIIDLGKRLNVALANKVQELAQYRSEFFGRLREILGNRQDIRIVGDRFVFQSEVLFPQGSADLSSDAQHELDLLAGALKEIIPKIPTDIAWVLRVDGHTDKRPISNSQFKSNWELSSARATAVVKYLIQQGIPPEHLAAAGFAEFQPIDPGNTEDAFSKNRRIEFRLTDR
jgi:chemotaxis protein MotB